MELETLYKLTFFGKYGENLLLEFSFYLFDRSKLDFYLC